MKSMEELQELLKKIDHRGYPAYKELKGEYRFPGFILSVDHVQGDPFASPSEVSVRVSGRDAAFDRGYYDSACKRIALKDHLQRAFAQKVEQFSFQAKGSGKSGLIAMVRPGQEILNRSGMEINPTDGMVTARLEIGFPANGRTINAGELSKILFDFLPGCVRKTLYQKAYDKKVLDDVMHLAVDQQYIRDRLKEKNLAAFVANGSILPRKSGISMLPMKEGIPFVSPASLEVSFDLPYHGRITGMGIQKGVTLIVGGGYHGKSTLLKALEMGVYNHIAGDGREFVITDESGVKLRAEDGRSIKKTDISMFIRNLPNGKDTVSFYSEDASGSTSQAANTVEAIEADARLFLIDEDTSATNFMIRDELMQRVVLREEEPIIPFIDRVRELYERFGISTILVAGSCGAYFHRADCVIQMNRYIPSDITQRAKEEAMQFPIKGEAPEPAVTPCFERIVKRDVAFLKEDRIKTKTQGLEEFSVDRESVDLRLVEQLAEKGQLEALAKMAVYMKKHFFDGKRTLGEAVEAMWRDVEEKEFAAFVEGRITGTITLPRKQELYAALNRMRGLVRMTDETGKTDERTGKRIGPERKENPGKQRGGKQYDRYRDHESRHR